MSPTIQRACVWCGAGLMVLFTLGLLIAGFLPPPPPGMTAEQVKQLYIEDKVRIRCGVLICFLGAVLLLPRSSRRSYDDWKAAGSASSPGSS